MRVYNEAPTALGSGTKTTTTTDGEPLIPATDAAEENAFHVTLQPGGAYAVNVGYAADHVEFVIHQGCSLQLVVNQLSKIFIKTAESGQAVNYIWYK